MVTVKGCPSNSHGPKFRRFTRRHRRRHFLFLEVPKAVENIYIPREPLKMVI